MNCPHRPAPPHSNSNEPGPPITTPAVRPVDSEVDIGGVGDVIGVGIRIRRTAEGILRVFDIQGDAVGRVHEGDTLFGVDGVPLSGKSDAAVRALLLGAVGSCAELSLGTGKGQYAVRITRGGMPVQEGRTRILGGAGLWVQCDEKGGGVRVKRVLSGGPAALSGVVEVGDTVEGVDGELVEENGLGILAGLSGDAVRKDLSPIALVLSRLSPCVYHPFRCGHEILDISILDMKSQELSLLACNYSYTCTLHTRNDDATPDLLKKV